jgi:hypothetical protein
MRALTIVLAILLIASVAVADKKVSDAGVQSGTRALDCTNSSSPWACATRRRSH